MAIFQHVVSRGSFPLSQRFRIQAVNPKENFTLQNTATKIQENLFSLIYPYYPIDLFPLISNISMDHKYHAKYPWTTKNTSSFRFRMSSSTSKLHPAAIHRLLLVVDDPNAADHGAGLAIGSPPKDIRVMANGMDRRWWAPKFVIFIGLGKKHEYFRYITTLNHS